MYQPVLTDIAAIIQRPKRACPRRGVHCDVPNVKRRERDTRRQERRSWYPARVDHDWHRVLRARGDVRRECQRCRKARGFASNRHRYVERVPRARRLYGLCGMVRVEAVQVLLDEREDLLFAAGPVSGGADSVGREAEREWVGKERYDR